MVWVRDDPNVAVLVDRLVDDLESERGRESERDRAKERERARTEQALNRSEEQE